MVPAVVTGAASASELSSAQQVGTIYIVLPSWLAVLLRLSKFYQGGMVAAAQMSFQK